MREVILREKPNLEIPIDLDAINLEENKGERKEEKKLQMDIFKKVEVPKYTGTNFEEIKAQILADLKLPSGVIFGKDRIVEFVYDFRRESVVRNNFHDLIVLLQELYNNSTTLNTWHALGTGVLVSSEKLNGLDPIPRCTLSKIEFAYSFGKIRKHQFTELLDGIFDKLNNMPEVVEAYRHPKKSDCRIM